MKSCVKILILVALNIFFKSYAVADDFLIKIVKDDNITEINKTIKLKGNFPDDIKKLIQSTDKQGNTALHYVQSVAAIRSLLPNVLSAHDKKEMLNIKNKMGQTPLHKAIIDFLNTKGDDGVVQGLFNKVNEILSYDLDLGQEPFLDNTPLNSLLCKAMNYVQGGYKHKDLSTYLDVLNLLVQKSPENVFVTKDDRGRGPLYFICQNKILDLTQPNNKTIFDKILQHSDSVLNDFDTDTKKTPLMLALQSHQWDVALKLLEKPSIDLNLKDDNQENALTILCRTPAASSMTKSGVLSDNFKQVAQTLIDKADAISGKDLCSALSNNMNNAIMNLLMHKNITDIDAVGYLGKSALLIAIEKNKIDIALKILDHPEINASTGDGETTPLHEAVKNASLDLVKKLLEKGAIVDKTDKNEKKPIDYAVDKKNEDIIDVLIAKDPNGLQQGLKKLKKNLGKLKNKLGDLAQVLQDLKGNLPKKWVS